ncbi:MAG: hypothetical protein P8103_03070 [Candidatus Thiodiazotropha sp.]
MIKGRLEALKALYLVAGLISLGVIPAFIDGSRELLLLFGVIPLLYLFATPFVYIFSFLLGLPFFLLLHSTLGLSKWRLIVGWAMVGVLSIFCLTGFTIPNRVVEALIFPPFALGGAAVGFAFWWILSTDPEQQSAHNGESPEGEERTKLAKISNENWR